MELDVVSMTCLMQYFGKADKMSECFKLFEHMISNGLIPTIFTYNVLLDNLCKKGYLVPAYKIFHDFKGTGKFPDTISYTILIHASARKGDLSKVNHLLIDMYSRGLVPNAITYASIKNVLCKTGKINAALHLENSMVDNGVEPSISYYNTILDSMLRMGRLWDVFLILVKMEIIGIELDVVSLKILNCAMSKGGRERFSKAMKVLEILMNRGESQLWAETG